MELIKGLIFEADILAIGVDQACFFFSFSPQTLWIICGRAASLCRHWCGEFSLWTCSFYRSRVACLRLQRYSSHSFIRLTASQFGAVRCWPCKKVLWILLVPRPEITCDFPFLMIALSFDIIADSSCHIFTCWSISLVSFLSIAILWSWTRWVSALLRVAIGFCLVKCLFASL